MKKFDIIRLALKNIWRRKTRTILTVSGVVIGTAAIVVMMSIGLALNVNFENQAKSWGDLTVIQVYRNYSPSGDVSKFDGSTVETFEGLKNVSSVMPFKREYLKIVSGKLMTSTQVMGIDSSKMETFGFQTDQGRLLQEGDKLTMVMGSQIPYEFYNPKKRNNNHWGGRAMSFEMSTGGADGETEKPAPPVNPMEDSFKLTFDTSYGEKHANQGGDGSVAKKPKLYKLDIAGVLKEKQDETSWTSYMDITELMTLKKEYYKSINQKLTENDKQYDEIRVRVNDMNNVQAVQEKIKGMGYQSYSPMESIENMQEQSKMIQLILGGIGAMSLLVAALGITNTMIMAIYERTKEIGIMKVIGCQVKNVRNIFLFEAGTMGFLGGAVGVGLSYALSLILNKFVTEIGPALGIYDYGGGVKTYLSVIPVWMAVAAIAFAMLIGLVSGAYPAFRATRLSALEAIKSEG